MSGFARLQTALFVAFVCLTFPCWAAPVRTVALSGEYAPGTSNDARFASFYPPVINSSGRAAFIGRVPYDSSMGDDLFHYITGLWSEGYGALSLVVFDGDHAPGTPNGTRFTTEGFAGDVDTMTVVALNDFGEVSFDCTYGQIFSLEYGIWAQQSGALELVARGNIQAPGLPDGTKMIWPFHHPRRLSSTGELVFSSQLAGDGIDPYATGVFSNGGGSLSLIARDGEPAPGLSEGVRFRYIDYQSIAISSDGNVAFEAKLDGGDFFYGDSIWTHRSGSLQPIAAEWDSAPGTNARFASTGAPRIGANGRVAFEASLYALEGAGVTASNDSGIWSDGTGNLSLVAREGSQAPGLPAGITFGNFWSPWSIDSSGSVSFTSSVLGSSKNSSNDSAVWAESLGSLELVAREGDPAPGTPAGAVFSEFWSSTFISTGRLALIAELRGPGISAANNLGLWVQDPSGALQLVFRRGDWLEVGHGDFRQISWFSVDPELGINDHGQIAFAAVFTDGSAGVFVSNRVAIPEPELPSVLLAVAASLLVNRTGSIRGQTFDERRRS